DVTREGGGALVGAQVTASELERGIVHSTVSDSSGNYLLANLPIGAYRLEAKAKGFKDYIRTGLALQVGTSVQIDIPMQVGAVNETVEVTASAALVETKETSVAQVINERRINELPLNGRQATQLILISGGAKIGR